MEWEASEALRKTAWVIAGFCRGKVSAVDVSFSFTFPHPLYFRINFLKWLMCPWDFCVMLNLPSVCHLSMASNDAGIQRGENYPILCGGTSGPSAAELGCYQPVMKLPSAISSLACGTSPESPGGQLFNCAFPAQELQGTQKGFEQLTVIFLMLCFPQDIT